METYKTLIGPNWIFTQNWGELQGKVRTNLLKKSNCSPENDELVSLCSVDQFMSRGDVFVIITAQRLIFSHKEVSQLLLADVTNIKQVSKNIVVTAGGKEYALFNAALLPKKELAQRMCQDLLRVWQQAKTPAGQGSQTKKSQTKDSPTPHPLAPSSAQVGKAIKKIKPWHVGFAFVWVLLLTVIAQSKIFGVILCLGVIGIAVAYLLHKPSREKIGKVLNPSEPESAMGRAIWLIVVAILPMLMIMDPNSPVNRTHSSSQTQSTPSASRGTSQVYVRRSSPVRRAPSIDIWHALASNNDTTNPMVVKVVRTLLVNPGNSKAQIDRFLRAYYAQAVSMLPKTQQNKLVFMYVYDSQHRIDRGAGEWIAMLQESGTNLPREPSNMTLRVPDYKNAPSKREQEVYEALQTALHSKEGQATKESVVQRRVARKLKMSTKKLNSVWTSVHLWRTGAENEATKSERLRKRNLSAGILLAKKVVSKKDWCETPKRIAGAWGKLRLFRRGDADYRKARSLTRRLERCRKKAMRDFSKALRKIMVAQRVRVAAKMEQAYLKNRVDMHINLSGRYKDKITYKYVLFSRPTVYRLVNSNPLLKRLERVGFKRVTFTNGYRFNWYYDLKPESEDNGGRTVLQGLGLEKPLRLR